MWKTCNQEAHTHSLIFWLTVLLVELLLLYSAALHLTQLCWLWSFFLTLYLPPPPHHCLLLIKTHPCRPVTAPIRSLLIGVTFILTFLTTVGYQYLKPQTKKSVCSESFRFCSVKVSLPTTSSWFIFMFQWLASGYIPGWRRQCLGTNYIISSDHNGDEFPRHLASQPTEHCGLLDQHLWGREFSKHAMLIDIFMYLTLNHLQTLPSFAFITQRFWEHKNLLFHIHTLVCWLQLFWL